MKLKSLKTLEYTLNGSYLSLFILNTSGLLNFERITFLLGVPILFSFVYEIEPKFLSRLDRGEDGKESFFEKDIRIKIIISIISFIYLWALSGFMEGAFYIIVGDFLKYNPTFNVVDSFLIILVTLLTTGFFIGRYILKKNRGLDRLIKRIYKNLFSSISKDEVKSDIRKFEKALNLEKVPLSYKYHFWSIVIVIGCFISFISLLFGLILFISLEVSLFLFFLIIAWLAYDIIESEITGDFSFKKLVKMSEKKSKTMDKLFFDFEILNYGVKGILVIFFILIGLFGTLFGYGRHSLEFLFTGWTFLNIYLTEFGLTKLYLQDWLFLLPFFLLPLMLFEVAGFLLMVWYSIIKRLSCWIKEPWNNTRGFKKTRRLPKHTILVVSIFVFGSGLIMNLLLYILERDNWRVISENQALIFLNITMVIVIILFFLLCRHCLKRIKSKKLLLIKSLKKDNYRINILIVILLLGLIPISYMKEGYGIRREDMVHTLYIIATSVFLSLVYLSIDINKKLREKNKNNVLSSLLSCIYTTFLVFYALLILRYFVHFSYIYLLIIPFALSPLYLALYFDFMHN